ncbi:MAG: hypothetical protein JXD23_15045 [Spirochaetales bacterium]|nr:hypothetical protein [Spirochaetales bacterium]
MRDRKSLVRAAVLGVLAAAVIISCATIPAGKTAADWLGVLPRDASYYLCLNTGRSRDLVVSVLKKSPLANRDVEQLVNFTAWAYCSVKIEPGGKPSFSIVTLGNYPLMVKGALDKSPDLEAVKGTPPRWRYRKLGLEIALPRDYLVAVSNGDATGLVQAAQSETALPGLSAAAVREIGENDLTLYFPLGWDDLVTAETGLVMPRKIFREIWLSARLQDDKYYFSGVFHVGPEVNARSFKKLLQFFFLALFRRIEGEGMGKRLAAVTFTAGDGLIHASGFYLTKKELEPLVAGIIGKGL